MTRSPRLWANLALLAAACGSGDKLAPWLTMPDRAAHARYFLIASGPHASADCNACHGGGDSFSQFDCLGCHAQAATDPFHPGLSGYAYQSASCYQCHPNGLGIAPANHPSFFPIDPAAKHADLGCTQCHSDPANPAVAANFHCATCHLSLDPNLGTRHTTTTSNPDIVVNDYAAASEACLRCHADSQVNWTSTHPTGGDGDPPHKDAMCTECHDTYRMDKPFGADFTTNPASWPVGSGHGCLTCHSTGVGGN